MPRLWKLERELHMFYSMANYSEMPTVWKLEGEFSAESAVWPT